MTQAKTHQNELERLAALEDRAEFGGGPKAIARHHDKGKLTARERLDLLFDPDSFVEVHKLAQSQSVDFGMQEKRVPGDGVVTGYGTIEGRSGLCLCPGRDGTGRLGRYDPWPKNLPHNG